MLRSKVSINSLDSQMLRQEKKKFEQTWKHSVVNIMMTCILAYLSEAKTYIKIINLNREKHIVVVTFDILVYSHIAYSSFPSHILYLYTEINVDTKYLKTKKIH